MDKKKIAVLFGGCSSEYGISLKSSYGILSHIDREKYEPVPIGITEKGDWFRYYGDVENIIDDSWQADKASLVKAYIVPDRSVHGMMELTEEGAVFTRLDGVFPVLHGKNGEDGTVQGLIKLAGIPLMGCGVMSSALCMDKYRAHVIAEEAGIAVPKAVSLGLPGAVDRSAFSEKKVMARLKGLTNPLFVKPVNAGSSYGISVVDEPQQVMDAVRLALEYDSEVIIEERIPGFEVGCSIIGNGSADDIVGRVAAIALYTGCFFDYTRKYTGVHSKIHTPARLDAATEERIKEAGRVLFKALGCEGYARIDMFLTPKGKIVFNEINTIPGFTSVSRFPKMLAGVGLAYRDVISRIIELGLAEG